MHDLENRIMEDIVRRIRINGEITASADWQMNRLVELGMSKREIKKIIRERLDLNSKEINHLYNDAVRKGYVRSRELYKAKGKPFIPFEENEGLQQLISAVSEQTAGQLKNITASLGFAVKQPDGTLKFSSLADYYQKTLDSSMLDISSGAFDYNTVIKRVVRELTNSGLRSVDYASGWSNRVDVAARRAVVTGLSQLTAKVNEDNAEALGTDMFEVTWHSGARPEHMAWQGKWYTKKQLKTVCGLGTVTGLCGANCRHDYYPVIPGISEPTYTKEELEAMNKAELVPVPYGGRTYTKYEATQRQRQLETIMRAKRQEIHLLETGGADESDIINARGKYRVVSAEYVRFSEVMGLPQQRERVTVDGLGNIGQGKYTLPKAAANKSGGGKAVEVDVKPAVPVLDGGKVYKDVEIQPKNGVDKSEESGIIKSDGNHAIGDPDGKPYEALYSYEATITEEVRAIFDDEYNLAVEKFGEFDTVHGVEVFYTKSADEGNYNDNSMMISLRHANKKDYLKVVSSIAQQKKQSGKWSTGHPNHAIRHELGHAIQLYHLKSDPNWDMKLNKIDSIFTKAAENIDGYTLPSEYSGEELDEFISECIAASYSKKPSKTVRRVLEIIMEEVS